MEAPFAPVVAAWLEKIRLGIDFKNKRFGPDAREGMNFYASAYSFLYDAGAADRDKHFRATRGGEADEEFEIPPPRFQMTCNKVAELVQIFGPVLYHRNPVRQVNPRTFPRLPESLVQMYAADPGAAMMMAQVAQQQNAAAAIDQARAAILEHYLNYTPTALDLKTESRRAIDEALIKGMGCLSGGTLVYAKIDERHTVVRVRDLMRVEGVIHLWDGSQWNRVVGIKKKPKAGGELKIRLRSGEEVNCTADHGWPTRRGLMRADQMVVGDVLDYVKIDAPEVEAGDLMPDEVGWLVGLYLGDGHIPSDKQDYCVCFAGHIDETDRHARLEKIVRRYGGKIKWKTLDGSKKCDATIYSRVLVAIIREYVTSGTAHTKHLKSQCWERSNAFLSAILEGYLDSDGHFIDDENVWRLNFCDNKDLAASIRVIAARLGHRLFLRRSKAKREGAEDYHVYRGTIRLETSKNSLWVEPGEIVDISPADWRCDYFYDISVECEPHTYCLASGLVTHNCLWTEVYTPPGAGAKMVGSFYDTVDNLVIDPDCKNLRDAKWVARRCCKPAWEVERMYGYNPGTLRPNGTSSAALAEASVSPDGEYLKAAGKTSDLIVYWEVYSKCGAGNNLSGVPDAIKPALEVYGDNVYLVVADGVHHPLNVPPAMIQQEVQSSLQAVAQAVAWPTPFWADGAWPFVPIVFHDIPEDPWPMSHLAPGLGELKFLNWMFSYLAGKIRITCRDFIAIDQSAVDDLVNTIMHGSDLSLIRIKKSMGKNIDEVVRFLQHPSFNGDVWRVVEMVMDLFDKRMGLTELMYGMSSASFRSAAEANVKRDQLNVRPEDMANKVEDAMSQVARQEALAARWHLQPQDVAQILGPAGTFGWQQFVTPSDPAEILFQLEYRVEAGSARKPNKDRDANNIQQFMGNFMAFFQQLAMQGLQLGVPQFVAPLNNMLDMWGKANDFDAARLMLPVPQPMQPMIPPPAPQGGENASSQAAGQ